MKLKKCPLLVQSDTNPSNLRNGVSWTRTYFLGCKGEECAAFYFEKGRRRCRKFDTVLEIYEDEKEDDHET